MPLLRLYCVKDLSSPWPTAPPVHYFALSKSEGDDQGNDIIHPAGKLFGGRVYVLTDASNSSATFQFARLMQDNKLATLVGEPTGGNLRGINGGAFFFLRLAKAQIEMDLPLIGTFPVSPEPDAGLQPDYVVRPSMKDIAEERDAVLKKAVEEVLRSIKKEERNNMRLASISLTGKPWDEIALHTLPDACANFVAFVEKTSPRPGEKLRQWMNRIVNGWKQQSSLDVPKAFIAACLSKIDADGDNAAVVRLPTGIVQQEIEVTRALREVDADPETRTRLYCFKNKAPER